MPHPDTDIGLRAEAFDASPWPALLADAQGRVIAANEEARSFFNQPAKGHSRPLASLSPGGAALDRLASRALATGAVVRDAGVALGDADGVVTASPVGEGAVLLSLMPLSAEEGARSAEGLSAAAGLGRTLAHEVKNPLAGIRGAAQLLLSNASAEDAALAQLIVDETERIRRLVDRVEAFSDARPPCAKPVNLHAVLDRVRRLISGGAPAVRFKERYDPSLPDAVGDEDQLVQVMLNLVKNAAEAAIEGKAGAPEVTLVTAWRQGGRARRPDGEGWRSTPLEVRVEDNGPGVAPALRARLFDPFVTGKARGEGLGLTLAAKLVTDHGGTLDFHSEPGRTVFRVLLPAEAAQP